jgi:hypothetical protein
MALSRLYGRSFIVRPQRVGRDNLGAFGSTLRQNAHWIPAWRRIPLLDGRGSVHDAPHAAGAIENTAAPHRLDIRRDRRQDGRLGQKGTQLIH